MFVWVGVHGGLASRRRVGGVAGTRVAICVCARCWAARGGQRTRGRRTRTHSCSLQVGLCKMRKKKDETLDGIFHTGTSTLSAFLLNIDRIDFIPEFTSYCEFGELL